MEVGINQSYYLPYMGLFDRIQAVDKFVINGSSVLNRTRANHRRTRIVQLTPNATDCLYLTQNVGKGTERQPMNTIDLDQAFWERQEEHIKTLHHTYRRAPHYDYTKEILEQMEQKLPNLAEYNFNLIQFMAAKLDLSDRLAYFSCDLSGDANIVNRYICQQHGADTHIVGQNGPLWLDEGYFKEADISVKYQQVGFRPYRQYSRSASFIPGLSTVDLLFNCGANAKDYLGGSDFVDRQTLLLSRRVTGR